MTPFERAEQIVSFFTTKLSPAQQDWLIKEIAAQIEEADFRGLSILKRYSGLYKRLPGGRRRGVS